MKTLGLAFMGLFPAILSFATEKSIIQNRLQSFSQSLTEKNLDLANNKCTKCLEGSIQVSDALPQVVVFASFSMSDGVWLALSQEIEKVGGAFVLQGLPSNSFKELAAKIYHLRQKGINATIQLHPQLFEQYQVNKVPTFMVIEGNHWDKLAGNISLKYALEVIKNKGECQIATQLLQALQEERL